MVALSAPSWRTRFDRKEEDDTPERDDLGLNPYDREKIEDIICRRVEEAVAGSATRDNWLVQFDLQLECRLQPNGEPRWPNGCLMNDPISEQVHLQMLSMVTQAQRKDPKWTVDADDPENDENASNLENWLTRKSNQYDLNKHLYDVAYAAIRDYGAILYCGWKQENRSKRVAQYHKITDRGELEKGFEPIRSEQRQAEHAYARVDDIHEPYVKSGLDFRTVEMIDFYLSPPNVQSIKRADGTCQRMLMTENELWDGIDDFGFDADKIDQLIEAGPTHMMGQGDQLFDIRNQFDGTSNGGATIQGQGFFEVFLVFMRCPRRQGSEYFDIPDELLHGDVMAMVCPSSNVVFQLEKSKYSERPYIEFNMIRRPNRFLGKGAMQFLTEIQEEMTHTLQLLIDAGNLEMSPVMICPYEDYNKISIFQVYPGAYIPEMIPGSIRPLEWGRNSIQQGIQLKEMLASDAHNLLSAEGYGELQDKVREKAETENMLGAVDTKFDLILYCMQHGTEELGYRIPALYAEFSPKDEETFRTANGVTVTITTESLRGEYRITPTATSSTSSPQNRIQIQQAILNAIVTYYKELPAVPPQGWNGFWNVTKRYLQELGVKNPEADLPEPQLPQMGMQPGAISPALAGLQQAGIAPPVQQTILGGVPTPAQGAPAALQAGGGVQ